MGNYSKSRVVFFFLLSTDSTNTQFFPSFNRSEESETLTSCLCVDSTQIATSVSLRCFMICSANSVLLTFGDFAKGGIGVKHVHV